MAASYAASTIHGHHTSGKLRSCHAIEPPCGVPRLLLPSPSPESCTDPNVPQVIVFLALLFSILIAIFAVQNTTAVAVTFLTFHSDSVAVSVLVLISAALGAAVMILLGIWRELTLRWRLRTLSQQLSAAQARVAELEKTEPAAATTPALTTSTPAPPPEGSTPAPAG